MLDGSIPACKWVRLACERQRRDLERIGDPAWPYRWDVDRAERVCEFIEHLPHIKGPKAGQPIQLEGWQCFILTTVFGWVWATGPRTGKRRFRRTYNEVPRGNAKSTLTSGVGLYLLGADREGGAEIYSAATSRDQARIVFNDAQQMARRSPALCAALGIEVGAHSIYVMESASKFEALSRDADSLEGKNTHGGLIDELHAHKTREVYDVIETSTGKRDQSLLWSITTAGSDRSGICYELRTYATKVLEGLTPDESLFAIIYTLDDGDDWTDEVSWRKANPNWGVSVMPEVIAQLAHKAMQMPAAQNNFKTKHLDVWVNADTAWMDMRAWDRCGDPTLDMADFEGEPSIFGLDLASKVDIAAKARLFWRTLDGVRHYYAFMQYYLPEQALVDGRNSQYFGWESEGRLRTTPGDVTDFDVIREEIVEESSRFEVKEIGFDPWQATQLATQLMAQGANMVEVRATVQNFSPAMKELDALVRSGRFHHDGDPVLAWMVSNVVCHMDAKENIYPRKERPENKIDGVVALLIALSRTLAEPIEGPSVYATRGLRVL